MNKQRLISVFIICLSLIFLYLTFKGLDFNLFWAGVSKVSPGWLIISLLISVLSHYLRGWKWSLILKNNDKIWTTGAIFYGYTFNLVFPRLGEIMRATIYSSISKYPVSYLLGTIAFERLLDFILFVSTLMVGVFIWGSQPIKIISSQSNLSKDTFLIVGIIAVLLLGVLLFVFRHKMGNKVKEAMRSFATGFAAFNELCLSNKVLYIALTLLIWVCWIIMMFTVINIFPEYRDISLQDRYLIFLLGSVGISLPSQGGIGTFHFLVSWGFDFLGVEAPRELNVLFATIVHLSFSLVIVLVTILMWGYRAIKIKT